MNPDGISYLDMGDSYFDGDWKMAVNAYWSPLYSWILASGLHIFHPSLRWEIIVVHLMQFIIYLFALFCFHSLLMEVIRWNKIQNERASQNFLIFSDLVWLILGYSLFLWSSLKLITLTKITPDMITVAFLYLAARFTLRILSGEISVSNFILLGCFLGLGYLARVPFFTLSIIFLIITFFGMRNFRKAIPLTLVSLLCFMSLAGPFILALSYSKGRFTIGESGKLTYAWKVNKVQSYIHWQGNSGFGNPKHSTRRVFKVPAIYEFASPIGGTYPPWYDPSYWYDGIETHFNFRLQLARIFGSLRLCIDGFFNTEEQSASHSISSVDALTVGYVILLLLSDRKRFALKDLAEQYPLLLPSIFGLSMYALIWVEPRYIAGYLVLLWLALFSSIRLPKTPENKRVSEVVAFAVSVVIILGVSLLLIFQTYGEFRTALSGKNESVSADIAEELQKMGVKPGSRISNIGYSFDAYWARLARVKIVSEIPYDGALDFWKANPDVRNAVYRKFAETGASIVVTKDPPEWANQDGWNEIGHTNYFLYILPSAAQQKSFK